MTRNARRSRTVGFTRLGDVIWIFLEELRAEAEANVLKHGPLRGPVQQPQRPWSHTLDALEYERQESTS